VSRNWLRRWLKDPEAEEERESIEAGNEWARTEREFDPQTWAEFMYEMGRFDDELYLLLTENDNEEKEK
jgi:hypothetical protein